jgi:hypothetical protein
VGGIFDFAAGICNGHRETTVAHDGKIDDVVADKSNFAGRKSFTLQYFAENLQFVSAALANHFEPEVASAKCHGFRVAPGDEAGLNSGDAGYRYACAILRVKAFGFDHKLALGRLNGEEKEFAVGEDAVYVEEKQFDFFGAGLGRF